MSTPPVPSDDHGQPPKRQPPTLEQSVVALARLNDQMAELNAKLEYLRLLLKLRVKR
jgi:hypothetical protein